jgi:hypothetical protein
MASTVTLKHYSDTKTTADTSMSLPITASSGYRLFNINQADSAHKDWDAASLHSLELVISAESGLIGCEIIAIGLNTEVKRIDK